MDPSILTRKVTDVVGVTDAVADRLREEGVTLVVHLVGKMMTLYERKSLYRPFVRWLRSLGVREAVVTVVSQSVIEISSLHTLTDVFQNDAPYLKTL